MKRFIKRFIRLVKEFFCFHRWEYMKGIEFFYDNSFRCSKCGKYHE